MKLYDSANNWATSTTSSFDARSYADTQIADRASGRAVAGTETASLDQYSVVGINANEIVHMQDAIEAYVKAIESHLRDIDPTASADSAFKNETVQLAVKEYIGKVKEYCMNLVSQLRAFNTKLDDIKSVWESNMSNLAGNVRESYTTFNTGGTYANANTASSGGTPTGANRSNTISGHMQ